MPSIISFVDSDYVNARVDALNIPNVLDSAEIIYLIDSDYVKARQTNYLDSSLTITLIDSNYVRARQLLVDSSSIINLVDSDYVVERSDTFIEASIQALDLGDIVGAAGTSGQYLRSLGTGDGEWITFAAPSYINFDYDSVVANDSSDTGIRMPVAGKVTHISMQLNIDTISAGQTLAVNLKKNGVLTGESITVSADSAGAFGASNSITEVTFVSNDLLSLNLVPSDATMVSSKHHGLLRILENL